MLSNIQSLTSGVSTLTQKVNELYAAVEKVSGVTEGVVGGVQGMLKTNGGGAHLATATTRPGTGADGARFAAGTGAMPTYQNMQNNMAKFSTPLPGAGFGGGGSSVSTSMLAVAGGMSPGRVGAANILGGLGQIGFGLAAGAYAATPPLDLTLSRSLGYYQAGLTMPGISRSSLQRATFSALGGGLSSVGSDALVSAILAGRGVGGGAGSADYLKLTSEVGNAYKYLGMENAPAAQALAGLRSGPMAANLYQYGITTYDSQGRMRGTGDIARQLMERVTAGRGFSNVESLNQSFYRGFLGANLRTMGFDEAQQTMLLQSMRDITMGGTGDLSTSKPLGDNQNTMLTSQGRLNASQTELMLRGESSMLKGFENAADTVETFNRALLEVIEPLGYLKGLISGVAGTNAGQGLATAAPSVFGGIKKTIIGGLLMAGGAGLAATGFGAIPGAALAGAGLGVALGSGSPGYGAGFNASTTTKQKSGSLVTAGFGAKSNTGIWASTNGVHKGMDYEMPIGSPVVAALSGVVSSVNPGTDYGTGVVVDHANGLQTVYGHLSQKNVNVGDYVSTGQRLGRSGASGNVTGPHLHFEVRKGNNNPVDPSLISNAGGIDPTSLYKSQKSSSYLTTSTSSTSNSYASDVTYVGMQGTKKEAEWARDLLSSLGAPHSDSNISAITTWMRFEGGGGKVTGIGANSAMYNPLNTTLDRPGATAMNSVGVKRYLSWEQGMNATVSTLLGNKASDRGYTSIVDALQSDAGVSAILGAVNNSAWRSGKVNDPGYKFPTGGGSVGFGASFSSPQTSSGDRNVYITVKYDSADSAAAVKLAKMVEGYLKNGANNSAIGGS
jgi:murein DD-endopeptidase MepM/ murein hydrolase activator NlpD